MSHFSNLTYPLIIISLTIFVLITPACEAVEDDQRKHLVIVFDGLRADYITPDLMPNLYRFGQEGVVAENHHVVYPPVTRVNSPSLATGSYPGTHGLMHNHIYLPEISEDMEPIIDIHQHTNYHGRSYEDMLSHQRAMGITTTILLPAGRPVNTASTHGGESNGLGGVQAGGNKSCYDFAQQYPDEFLFGANEVPDLPDAIEEIEKYLKLGAHMIGESKFGVECDSPEMRKNL